MLLKSFCHIESVDRVLLRTLKFECAFCYSNIHQMFSNILWALIYFIRKATCVYIFKCIRTNFFEHMLLILILNVLNDKKRFKICYHGFKKKCTF
jgi:hypothetical protein